MHRGEGFAIDYRRGAADLSGKKGVGRKKSKKDAKRCASV
jgi:hypothetical protein